MPNIANAKEKTRGTYRVTVVIGDCARVVLKDNISKAYAQQVIREEEKMLKLYDTPVLTRVYNVEHIPEEVEDERR